MPISLDNATVERLFLMQHKRTAGAEKHLPFGGKLCVENY
jgi:hypothetical protein